MPQNLIQMVRQDNSGVGRRPFRGTSVLFNRRFLHLKHKVTNDEIRGPGLPVLVRHFNNNLRVWIQESSIGEEWTRVPDLYRFLRDMLFRVSVDAYFGPHLLRDSSHLMVDFWQFDEDLPSLAKGLPRIFKPRARTARDRCIQTIRAWRDKAKRNQLNNSPHPGWDEYWGLRSMRLRNELFTSFKEWDDHACAATDTALLWAVNTNVIPATFWFILETISLPVLLEEVRLEIEKVVIDEIEPTFDMKKLLSSPYSNLFMQKH